MKHFKVIIFIFLFILLFSFGIYYFLNLYTSTDLQTRQLGIKKIDRALIKDNGVKSYSIALEPEQAYLVEVEPIGDTKIWLAGKYGSMPELHEEILNTPDARLQEGFYDTADFREGHSDLVRSKSDNGKYELLVTPSGSKVYFFNVYVVDSELPISALQVTIIPVDKHLSTAYPQEIGVDAKVTLEVKGLGFNYENREVDIYLENNEKTIKPQKIIQFTDYKFMDDFDVVFPVFNIKSKDKGEYNLVVVWPDGTKITNSQKIKVTKQVPAKLVTEINAVKEMVAFEEYPIYIKYMNGGNVDLTRPLLRVQLENAIFAPIKGLNMDQIGNSMRFSAFMDDAPVILNDNPRGEVVMIPGKKYKTRFVIIPQAEEEKIFINLYESIPLK